MSVWLYLGDRADRAVIDWTTKSPTIWEAGILGGNGDDVITFRGRTSARRTLESVQIVELYGGRGNDTVDASQIVLARLRRVGTNRPNTLWLSGNHGDDTVLGSRHRDLIEGGPGSDTIRAGSGNDRIDESWIGGADHNVIECGPGHDTVLLPDPAQVDPSQTVPVARVSGDCERIRLVRPRHESDPGNSRFGNGTEG